MSTHRHLDIDGNLAWVIEDNEDGTGTQTFYDAQGNVTDTVDRDDLPIPEPQPQTEAERLADLEAALNALAGGSE